MLSIVLSIVLCVRLSVSVIPGMKPLGQATHTGECGWMHCALVLLSDEVDAERHAECHTEHNHFGCIPSLTGVCVSYISIRSLVVFLHTFQWTNGVLTDVMCGASALVKSVWRQLLEVLHCPSL